MYRALTDIFGCSHQCLHLLTLLHLHRETKVSDLDVQLPLPLPVQQDVLGLEGGKHQSHVEDMEHVWMGTVRW